MSQFKKVVSAVRTHIESGTAMHAAIASHLVGKYAPAELLEAIAGAVVNKFANRGCESAELRKSGWMFLDADGKRSDAAQRFWQREIRRYDATPLSSRGGARSQSVDPVAKQIEALLGKFSLAERRRIAAAIVKG